MFGIGPYAGLKFSCFNTIKGIFNKDRKLNSFQNFAMGSFSGCFAVTLTLGIITSIYSALIGTKVFIKLFYSCTKIL